MKRKLHILATAVVVLAIAGVVADAASLKVSLGTRETNKTTVAIGGDGGGSGGTGIEWVAPVDSLDLPMDGQWRQYSFSMNAFNSPSFTGNGTVDGTAGALEHLRFVPDGVYSGPYKIWIDDVAETVAGAAETVITSFAGAADNDQVMFRQPSFSGSTSANLLGAPNFSGVDNTVGHTDNSSLRVEFQFVDATPHVPGVAGGRWLRLTTNAAPSLPNPNLYYGEGNVVTVWMKAVPEPATLSLLALGTLFIRRRRA
ncbi:MAG TPA: PEP-CTERM sorting domain-containing protein [Phycisphaerae bacterium]|nr:PEP-CTERM sorting domain-containing protein [Phycisphaerae bacterium]HRY70797.1 PEP-CTERM sorting domain-containing protein [Phycisphaerae bacterium]HSA29215.1 PEP-CTERM sorting domain-containing protein [Phycisphaerae bacterium]